MTHMRLWAAAGIIACVVIVGFILSVPRVGDGGRVPSEQGEARTVLPVSLRDTYKKGVHTITGAVKAKTACSQVDATATLKGDVANPEGIVVEIAVTDPDGVCLQLPTSVPFSTTINAPSGLPVTVTLNGANATTTAL